MKNKEEALLLTVENCRVRLERWLRFIQHTHTGGGGQKGELWICREDKTLEMNHKKKGEKEKKKRK